jgi:cytidyltransferase-like protein
MKIVLVTGGFDPLHSGHIEYFKAAKALGDKLIVGLNSDAWLERKKGRAFMPLSERRAIVGSMRDVDSTLAFDDSDGSACALLRELKTSYSYASIVFANGGDRTADNIPEMTVEGVEFAFGVGGENKANSSSWILEDWKAPKTERPWGYYRVLHEVAGTKVKELTINPGQKLSMQRHTHRAEHWHVTEGMCQIDSQMPGGYYLPPKTLSKHMTVDIPAGEWHQLANPYDEPCKLVEIQYGPKCDEDDIERR